MVRHFHVSNIGPCLADPTGLIVLVETDNTPRVEGVVAPMHYWTGWRARVIRWLINRWLPALPKDNDGRFRRAKI